MTSSENARFLDLRKKLIASAFRLNDMQLQAVMTTEGPLLLLAGAGSGKTTVLINRIGNLIRFGDGSETEEIPAGITNEDVAFLEQYAASGGTLSKNGEQGPDFDRAEELVRGETVEPWRIMAITFTNKAADELKERLRQSIGEAGEDVWAMTFHKACVRILRRDIDRLGYDRAFTIYDMSDCQSLMKRIIADLGFDDKAFPHKTVLNYISRAKDRMETPGTFQDEAKKSGDIRREKIGRIYEEYEKRLREANAVDFDDLLLLTVRLLLEHEEVRDHYQRRFKYILIDEYQDTNNLQYLFASALAGGWGNICVVGDDDQSIYKFRGATIENILNFENQYPNARTIRLEQNYRSTGHILDAANAVIRNNEGRKGKTLWTDLGQGEPVVAYTAMSSQEEAQYIASKILESYAETRHWSDLAVLYRMNALSNGLEYALKRDGIPYKVFGGLRFFDRAEVKDVLAYLCVINSPHDDLRLLRIINVPARGIGAKSVETLRQIAMVEGRSLYDVLGNLDSYRQLDRAAAKLRMFRILLDELREAVEQLPLGAFYDLLMERTGYLRALEESDKEENIARIENIRELKSSVVQFMERNPEAGLSGFLDEISLYTDLEELGDEDEYVTVMSLHSAKGLEFPTVFIMGMEDGIFPGIRSIGEAEEMEEERRLCYVGLTRAKRKLYLTCARQRMLFGRTAANLPSRFLDEIPEECLESPADMGRQSLQYPSYRPGETERFGESASVNKTPAAKTKKTAKPVSSLYSAPKATGFKKGDQVDHKAFGRGVITSLQPMGNDALIEIAFDGVGTKKLMLNAASAHMKRV